MSENQNADVGGFQMPGPGPEHERLRPFLGRFRAEVKMWMGPGQPMVTTGTMENSWQLNGLYLHQDYQGDESPGIFPGFQGKGYWGFNTMTGQYEGFWIDVASSMMQMEYGSVDDSGKVWTMLSECAMPPNGQIMKRRSVITLTDQDHHTMESYVVGPDGKDHKTMEITYQRIA